MSILDQIANPKMADIVGALDARQQRIDRDEAKRKEIRMGQLIAQSLPHLKEGSPLREMAETMPREFSAFAKAAGIPLNDGERMQQFVNDTETLYTLAKNDPKEAFDYALNLSEERKEAGLNTAQIDKFIEGMREDPQRTMTGLFMTRKILNRDEEIRDRKLGLEERALDIQEKRINSEQNKMVQGTSDQKNWDEYQRLRETDPEAADQFGRAAGFVSDEGQKLSAFAEKQLAEASDEFTSASSAVSRYSTLADKLRNADMSGGVASTWTEYVKEQTGNQDEITALRKEALAISNSEAIKNLPPGPATDRDIQIVMAPFPTEKASPKYVADWLGAMARLNEKRAQYAEFKSDFIARNGTIRDKKNTSLTSAWKRFQEESQGSQAGGNEQNSLSARDQQALDWAKANPDDPRSAAILRKLGMQ